MKTFLFITLVILSSVCVKAEEGIHFQQGSWSQIVAKAAKEKKLIFIDCYTSWCIPCKTLAAEVFPQQQVGDYFNKNFLSYKLDMEKGEGITLSKTYHIGAYPTLLWVDADGNLVHRAVGAMKADALLAEAQKALKGGFVGNEAEQAYNKQKDDPAAVEAYLRFLHSMADSREREVALHYLSIIPPARYTDNEVYQIISKQLQSPFSPVVDYIMINRSTFDEKFGKVNVERMLEEKYSRFANALIVKVKSGQPFNEQALQSLDSLMEQRNIPTRRVLIETTKIKAQQYKGDWIKYAAMVDAFVASRLLNRIPTRTWVDWYSPVVASDCTNKQVLERAITWIDSAFHSNEAFSIASYKQYWADKEKLLQRAKDKDQMLLKVRAELSLLAQLEAKQAAYNTLQAEKRKMLESFIEKKSYQNR